MTSTHCRQRPLALVHTVAIPAAVAAVVAAAAALPFQAAVAAVAVALLAMQMIAAVAAELRGAALPARSFRCDSLTSHFTWASLISVLSLLYTKYSHMQ